MSVAKEFARVKSGASLFTSRNPSVYRGFSRFGEE